MNHTSHGPKNDRKTYESVRLFSGIEPEMLDLGNQHLAQCANERTQLQDVEKGLFTAKQRYSKTQESSEKCKNTEDTNPGQKAIN